MKITRCPVMVDPTTSERCGEELQATVKSWYVVDVAEIVNNEIIATENHEWELSVPPEDDQFSSFYCAVDHTEQQIIEAAMGAATASAYRACSHDCGISFVHDDFTIDQTDLGPFDCPECDGIVDFRETEGMVVLV